MSTKALPAIPEEVDNDDEAFTKEIEIRQSKDPLYITIFYTFSLCLSIGGLGCATWGYLIVITAPFAENSKKGKETDTRLICSV
jgi:hypothetical protein